jgi:hypothetical protein
MAMFKEQRAHPRETIALPVRLDNGQTAMTRDISGSGMYLELQGVHHLEGSLLFEMHLTGARIKFTAEGIVQRVDHGEGRTGVAVKLVSPRLQSLP